MCTLNSALLDKYLPVSKPLVKASQSAATVSEETVLDEFKMSRNYRLLVKNAKQVVLICNNGEKYLTKNGMQSLCVIENGSIIIGR